MRAPNDTNQLLDTYQRESVLLPVFRTFKATPRERESGVSSGPEPTSYPGNPVTQPADNSFSSQEKQTTPTAPSPRHRSSRQLGPFLSTMVPDSSSNWKIRRTRSILCMTKFEILYQHESRVGCPWDCIELDNFVSESHACHEASGIDSEASGIDSDNLQIWVCRLLKHISVVRRATAASRGLSVCDRLDTWIGPAQFSLVYLFTLPIGRLLDLGYLSPVLGFQHHATRLWLCICTHDGGHRPLGQEEQRLIAIGCSGGATTPSLAARRLASGVISVNDAYSGFILILHGVSELRPQTEVTREHTVLAGVDVVVTTITKFGMSGDISFYSLP
ncbi:hypothetical protein PM082_004523 [Marasmius tenuissimus]|nr:hypothetical protein PM082_004523 [Marasmius tenuissimus]